MPRSLWVLGLQFPCPDLFQDGGPLAGEIAYPSPEDVLEAGCKDGLVMVLAHPGRYNNFDSVPRLVAAGLAGIEVLHPDHTPNDIMRAKNLAQTYDLFVAAGSDSHGTYGPAVPFGQDVTPLIAEGFCGVWDHPALQSPRLKAGKSR